MENIKMKKELIQDILKIISKMELDMKNGKMELFIKVII